MIKSKLNMNWKAKNNIGSDNSNPMKPSTRMDSEEELELIGDIRVVDNRILFYSDIDDSSCLELNRLLMELDNKLQTLKVILRDDYEPIIHLHLNTNGGSVFSAFSTVNTMNALKSKVYTYIDGYVASAGTIISCKGDKRFIGKYGHMMIHQLSGEMYGKYTEMEDSFTDYSNLMKLLKQFYKEYTKVPMKKIDEILQHDLSMTSKECLEYGLVDKIL